MNRLELPVKLVLREGDSFEPLSLVAEHEGQYVEIELPPGAWVGGLIVGRSYSRTPMREMRNRRELYDREGPDA